MNDDLFDRIYHFITGGFALVTVAVLLIAPFLLIPYIVVGVLGVMHLRPQRSTFAIIVSLMKFYGILTVKLGLLLIALTIGFFIVKMLFGVTGGLTGIIVAVIFFALSCFYFYTMWIGVKELILKNIRNQFINAIIG